MFASVVVVATVAGVGFGLSIERVRTSVAWRATVTPLASIIGSGFLVVAPLLAATVGAWAPVAMAAIVVLAYGIGAALRFGIVEVEPRLERADAWPTLRVLERLSQVLLSFAYVVSVAFYVRLMASFVLRSVDSGDLAAQVLSTAVLVSIGTLGWKRGLHGLELLEETAVGVKLAIIGGLLAGLALLNIGDPGAVVDSYRLNEPSSGAWTTVRVLAGMLLVVQGFETSRYLGAHYSPAERVSSMRNAQLLSALIYVSFVALGVRVFDALPSVIDETAILDVADEVTVILAPLLIIAAVASQLSAAVADTAGAGEMLTGATSTARRRPGASYLMVAGGSIALVWSTDVFGIVSLASRAFAAYYLLQVSIGLVVALRVRTIPRRVGVIAGFAALAAVLAFVVIFAVPADS